MRLKEQRGKIRKVMLLIGFLVMVGFGEVITFDHNWGEHPLFNITVARASGVEIVFSMHQMVIEEKEIDGLLMKSFGVPAVFIPEPGVPNLTGATRYLALPQDAHAQVTIINTRTEVYHNVLVAPAPNIPRESDNSPLRYEKNMKIYGANAYWPDSPVQLSDKMQMRGVDVVLVSVLPFQHNPVTKDLIVYKDIRLRVDFIGGNGHFGEDRLRSRFWEPILQNNLLNYNQLPKINFYPIRKDFSNWVDSRTGFEYIIIVPDDPIFIAWGDTIRNWRKLQGISCDVFTLTEIGGSDSTHIKSFLQNAYNTWNPAPVAFLLLSDYPSSGRFYGITSPKLTILGENLVSDNWYADMNNDNLPDMHHGRICAQTDSQLNIMINKFLGYERDPYNDPNFYDRPLTIGPWDDNRWYQLCNEVIRGFWERGLSKTTIHQYVGNPPIGCPWSTRQGTRPTVQYWYDFGWLEDTLNPYGSGFWNNGSTIGIIYAINSGTFLINFRDYGAETAWGTPPFDITHLDNLINDMFPFVLSMVCLTGKYNYSSQCFTEKFHRITHGALGLNAATEVSYTFVNDVYAWGICDGLWPQFDIGYPNFNMTGYPNLGPCMAMTHGKYYLQASWFVDSAGLGTGGYREITYHLFHHHGDCFTTLYSEIPESLTVIHASTLPAGQTFFTVTANDSSVIALTVNGEIIGVTEGTGSPVDIPIPSQYPPDIMKVTVTKANYYRYVKDVPIVVAVEESDWQKSDNYVEIRPTISLDNTYDLNYNFNTETSLQIQIFNVAGTLIYSNKLKNIMGTGKFLLVLKKFPQGVYFVRLETDDFKKTKKIIRSR